MLLRHINPTKLPKSGGYCHHSKATTHVYVKYFVKAVSQCITESKSLIQEYRMHKIVVTHIFQYEFDILENKLAVPSQNCVKLLFTPPQLSVSVTHHFFHDKVKLSLNFMLKSNGHDVMVWGQNDSVCLLTEKAYSCMFGWERSI